MTTYATQNLDNAIKNNAKVWVNPAGANPYVEVSEPNGEVVAARAVQAQKVAQMESFVVVGQYGGSSTSGNGNASGGAAFAGQTVEFRFKPDGSIKWIEDVELEFQLKETAGSYAVTPAEVYNLFTRVEWYVNGAAEKWQTQYPIPMLHQMGSTLSQDQRIRVCEAAGLEPETLLTTRPIPASGTRKYTWPLFGNWIAQQGGIYLPAFAKSGEIGLRVYLASSGTKGGDYDQVTAGGVGTLGIQAFNIILETKAYPKTVDDTLEARYNGKVEMNFLDCVIQATNPSITAGTEYPVQLTAVSGMCPYALLAVRQNNTNNRYISSSTTTNVPNSGANNLLQAFEPIGHSNDGAYINVTDQIGNVIPGSFNWYPERLLGLDNAKHLPGRFSKQFPLYPLIFGDPMAAMRYASLEGFISFNNNEYLRFKTAASGTETGEVYTVTKRGGGTPASGTVQFSIGGISTKPMVYNATKVVVQAEMNRICQYIPGANGCPIICTVGGSDLPSAMTFTFTNQLPVYKGGALSRQGKALSLCANIGAGTTDHATYDCVLTTAGVPNEGFITGTYYVDLFCMLLRHSHWSASEGKFLSVPLR